MHSVQGGDWNTPWTNELNHHKDGGETSNENIIRQCRQKKCSRYIQWLVNFSPSPHRPSRLDLCWVPPERKGTIPRHRSCRLFIKLPRGAPNFRVDSSIKWTHKTISLYQEAYKINTDGRNVRFGIGIIGEPKKQGRFTDARISDEEKFEEIVAVRSRLWKSEFMRNMGERHER